MLFLPLKRGAKVDMILYVFLWVFVFMDFEGELEWQFLLRWI